MLIKVLMVAVIAYVIMAMCNLLLFAITMASEDGSAEVISIMDASTKNHGVWKAILSWMVLIAVYSIAWPAAVYFTVLGFKENAVRYDFRLKGVI